MAHLDIPALGTNHKKSAFKVDQRQGKNFIKHDQERLDAAVAKRKRKNETRAMNHSYSVWRLSLANRTLRMFRLSGTRGLAGWSGKARSK